MKVATLAHGLDRVLFNPGVHWLRDPRTGIYNFSPSLRRILDPDLFDYEALPPYITSSQDNELETLARRTQSRYTGSTSSLTALLSHCYFLISGRKPPNLSGFSEGFKNLGNHFTVGASLPASIKLVLKPPPGGQANSHNVYAIDADKSASGELENSNYVLAALGKSMEKMLTVDDAEFQNFHRVERWKRDGLSGGAGTPQEAEAYHYTKLSNFLMRSQLDCYDPRLPNKTFDLKTRAAVAVRQDRANWIESSGYQIRTNLGLIESFEREYYDMVRAAFLKYGFQARIGGMDGIFVAYHNTKEIFGFQYVPLSELFERVFGTVEMGEQAFTLSVRLLEAVLDSATKIFPDESLRLTMNVGEGRDPSMRVFVEPMNKDRALVQTTPAPTSDEQQAPASEYLEFPGSRSLVLLDVKVDRQLDGQLVQGRPVDFATPPGRAIDAMRDDEISRRKRQSLAPLDWTIDYVIQPRADLSEQAVASQLDSVRATQISLTSLYMPNLEAVAAREVELEEHLRKAGGEAAVQRWRAERAEGKIGRMPRAPGQAQVNELEAEAEEGKAELDKDVTQSSDASSTPTATATTAEKEEGGAASEPGEATTTTTVRLPHQAPEFTEAAAQARPDEGEGSWTTNTSALRRVQYLRGLARLGAQDRLALEKTDRLEQVDRKSVV